MAGRLGDSGDLRHTQEAGRSRRDEGLDMRVREEGRWRGRDLEQSLEEQGPVGSLRAPQGAPRDGG